MDGWNSPVEKLNGWVAVFLCARGGSKSCTYAVAPCLSLCVCARVAADSEYPVINDTFIKCRDTLERSTDGLMSIPFVINGALVFLRVFPQQ
jgi:hypothetical protein